MITKETVLSKVEMNPEYKTVSIRMDTVIKEDELEISRSSHRCGFGPGDILKVKEYIGVESSPEIDYLNAVWVTEVIAAHLASQESKA